MLGIGGRDAADSVLALQWLERAQRIAPEDDTIALSLAVACLSGGAAGAGRGTVQAHRREMGPS